MKGIVFTEFLELVEEKFGLEVVDEIIEKSQLKSQGIYTAIGTYEFSEMLQLLNHLSDNTGISIDNLLLVYGEHLFSVLDKSYPSLMASYNDPIEMLSSIENHIHIEVRKLYEDAELPKFTNVLQTKNKLVINYTSQRELAHFAIGLIKETLGHFNKQGAISMEKLTNQDHTTQFTIEIHEQ